MRRRLGAGALVFLGPVVLAGCSEPDPNAFTPMPASVATTVLAEGDGWVFEFVLGQECVRLRVGDDVTFCSPFSDTVRTGNFSRRLDDEQSGNFVLASADTSDGRAKLFSSAGEGVPMATATMEGTTWAIAELADGEIPWGVQIVDATGALVLASSLLD